MIYFSNIFPLSVNDNVFPSPKSRLENDICCLPSGTTLNLNESIDFVHWVRIHLLSLTQTCIFFVFYDQTSTFFIKISAILFRKLHVIYSYCTSSSLLAGGCTRYYAFLSFFWGKYTEINKNILLHVCK